MISSLSVLIPVYNAVCTDLVRKLLQQARTIEGLRFEIVVADDGSVSEEAKQANRVMNQWVGCRLIERAQNVGRAAIRNFLAQTARGAYLLYLDSDVRVVSDQFLLRYVQCDGADVVQGGYVLQPDDVQAVRGNLRYRYELACCEANKAHRRAQNPYQSFKTSNFMIRRSLLLQCMFDERIRRYGYEDILFGKQLMRQQARVVHIHNVVALYKFDTNAAFLQKTEDALHNLFMLKDEMAGFTKIQAMADRLHRLHLDVLLLAFYALLRPLLRRNLLGKHPNVKCYNVYRLGYYIGLRK